MKRYRVVLSAAEREYLSQAVREGKFRGTKLLRAQILLACDEPPEGKGMSDEQILHAYGGCVVTIYNTRRRYVEEGIDLALHGKPRPINAKRKIDGRAESKLIALRCSDPPEGENRWSLRLLADRLVELGYVESITRQGVDLVLKKHRLSLGKSNLG